MSVQDRLLVLLNQARQTGGDAALRDAAGLRSRLSSQAPDLYGEIQALAAALAMGAPVRIAGAVDADAERAAIAADIARQERLSLSVVEPGLAVACLGGAGIGPADASAAPPAGGDDWAGDSIVVGAAESAAPPHRPGDDGWVGDSVAVGTEASTPQPQSLDKGAYPPPEPAASPPPFAPPPPFAAPPPFAPPQPAHYPPPQGGYGQGGYGPGVNPYGGAVARPFYAQTWFFALVAAFIIAAAVGYTVWRNWGGSTTTTSNAPQPGPNPGRTPPGPQPPVTPPQTGNAPRPGGPTLSAVGGPTVRLPLQTLADGRIGIGFRVMAQSGPIDGMIVLPRGGWDGETMVFASNGAGARSVGTGRLMLEVADDNTPSRGTQVQWQQDGVGAGATEIAFASEAGNADVVLSGAGMCIADPESGQIIGCGQIE